MKRTALLLLALIGAIPLHAETIFSESEPNNSLAQAQFLNTQDSQIVVVGDRTRSNPSADWFRVWGDQGSTFDILVRTPGGALYEHDPIVGLFDHGGQELAYNNNLLGVYGLDSGIFNYRVQNSGYYYVAVSARGDRNFLGGPSPDGRETTWSYNLSIGRTSVPEPSEWAMIGLSVVAVAGLMYRASQNEKIS